MMGRIRGGWQRAERMGHGVKGSAIYAGISVFCPLSSVLCYSGAGAFDLGFGIADLGLIDRHAGCGLRVIRDVLFLR